MSFYNCKSTSTPFVYRVTKFDLDLNPETSYLTSVSDCSCPAGYRPTCRHRQMLPKFMIEHNRVDTGWFFEFETRRWHFMEELPDDKGGQDISPTVGSDSVD